MIPALPLQPLNHISFQVPSVKESLSFYSNVLGFVQIARPDFEFDGAWLFGHSILIHLIHSNTKQHCLHSMHYFYVNDGRANDFDQVEDLLLRHQVPFWKQRLEKVGATQIFFRDPDGNVIEVGSCTVPVGSTNCRANSLA